MRISEILLDEVVTPRYCRLQIFVVAQFEYTVGALPVPRLRDKRIATITRQGFDAFRIRRVRRLRKREPVVPQPLRGEQLVISDREVLRRADDTDGSRLRVNLL